MSLRCAIGVGMLTLCLLTALLGPGLVEADPYRQNLSLTLAPPSQQHPLGTDSLGRSLLSRMVHGARESLLLAAVCVTVYLTLGLTLGLAAGIKGGLTDVLIMRLCDGLMAFPGILLALVVAGFIGGGRWDPGGRPCV